MYVVFLAGGIASGKSAVARELERLGARRIDLDQVSRDVLGAGTPTTMAVADAFGGDLVDAATGVLDRRLLAERAFASPDAATRLESIELPAIRARMLSLLDALRAEDVACCVVEVPLPDRMPDLLARADETVAVCCPADTRLSRAVARGMSAADARARMARQPSDAWLREHAHTVIDNVGTPADLHRLVRVWWDERVRGGWAAPAGEAMRHGA